MLYLLNDRLIHFSADVGKTCSTLLGCVTEIFRDFHISVYVTTLTWHSEKKLFCCHNYTHTYTHYSSLCCRYVTHYCHYSTTWQI